MDFKDFMKDVIKHISYWEWLRMAFLVTMFAALSSAAFWWGSFLLFLSLVLVNLVQYGLLRLHQADAEEDSETIRRLLKLLEEQHSLTTDQQALIDKILSDLGAPKPQTPKKQKLWLV